MQNIIQMHKDFSLESFHQKFLEFITAHELIDENDKILIAVSGGMDSIAMFYLFLKTGFSFEVAHFNFLLRGKDSENDENFVKDICVKNKVKFHVNRFDARLFADENAVSVEMAARKLRYDWFKKLVDKYNFTKIAIAHHKNDQLETILLNLTKGCSVAGLRGMKPRTGIYIRPLLDFKRTEIENYIHTNELSYCFDYTNDDIKYQRNFIRHRIIPELKKINPDLENSISENANYLREFDDLMDEVILKKINEIGKIGKNEIKLNIQQLKECKYINLIFYKVLSINQINPNQIKNLKSLINSQTGKFVNLGNFKATIDREFLVIKKNEKITDFSINVDRHFEGIIETPKIKIKIKTIDYQSDINFKDLQFLHLDNDKLSFPLQICYWKHGDKFIPFGMNNFKKISDFLTEMKVPNVIRNHILVVKSSSDIAGVVGYRCSQHFRITKDTKRIFQIEVIKN